MKRHNKIIWLIAGSLVGGAIGYIYWSKIGCASGSCPIKSKWETMVPYGIIMGYLVTDIIFSTIKKA